MTGASRPFWVMGPGLAAGVAEPFWGLAPLPLITGSIRPLVKGSLSFSCLASRKAEGGTCERAGSTGRTDSIGQLYSGSSSF